MKTKTHIFSENLVIDGQARTWSYGKHKALTSDEVEVIKKLLPTDSNIIQIDIVEPGDYKYPTHHENN